MKRFLCVVILCVSGCISMETKILSRRIASSTQQQSIELTAKLRGDESPGAKRLLKRAEKLSEVTEGLADLLGAPEDE